MSEKLIIENINTGICQWRVTNGEPPHFVNWKEDGKNKYMFFPTVSGAHGAKETLQRLSKTEQTK
jgi:hypothetical protein